MGLQKAENHLLKLRPGFVGLVQHFVVGILRRTLMKNVGHTGDPEDLQFGMAGHQDFGNGRHPHRVGAAAFEEPDFGRGFVGGACERTVDPFLQGNPF